MFVVSQSSNEPIFEQIISQTKQYIQIGLLKPGDKLPSVRALAEELGINPNTVSKAYQKMELLGIIVSSYKRGYFISSDIDSSSWKEEQMSELKTVLDKLAGLKIPLEDIIDFVNVNYKQKGE